MKDDFKIDGHKLNHHPERVASWKKGEDIYPIYMEVGLTSICNHRCIFCALDYTGYKGESIKTQVLQDALTDMAKNNVKSIMFSGEGEPTLHKDFLLFVEHAKRSGIDVALTTNGVPFTKSIAEKCLPYLSWVKFSIDAGKKETYAKIHGTKPEDFEKLMDNIKTAVQIKNNNEYAVKIGTQIILMDINADEVVVLAERLKEIGVDYLVVKPYSQHPNSIHKLAIDYQKFMDLKEPLTKLNSKNFKVIFREETMNKLKKEVPYDICHGSPFFAIIDDKGNVLPCHIHHEKEDYYFGNLYKDSFSQIWKSKRRKEVLERMNKEGTKNCRENCRLDSINRYLHKLKHPPEHINFI